MARLAALRETKDTQIARKYQINEKFRMAYSDHTQ